MDRRWTFRLLSCLVCLCHYELTLQRPGKQPKHYVNYELNVTGEDMKPCEEQKNVCVTDDKDCGSVRPHKKDVFLNISCRYFLHEKSFGCKWIYSGDVKSILINSFIFSQTIDFSHCPSIFNPLAELNLSIKSKDVFSDTEVVSDIYTMYIATITQAPTPTMLSVHATETSLNVTWSNRWPTKFRCQLRYKDSTMEKWTEVSETDSAFFHFIHGLQPFRQYSITVACLGEYGLRSDWSAKVQKMTLEDVPTAPPDVTYCVESLDLSLGTHKLLLMWRPLEISQARGVILGYEVTCASTQWPSQRINTPDQKAELVLSAGDYNITLLAYNSAGKSPVRVLRINTQLCECLPRVKGLWATTEEDSLKVQWKPEKTAGSASEFAIEWSSFGASKQQKRVNGDTFSSALTGPIKQSQKYVISVYPLHGSLCGPPASIQANLESGTLLDISQLQLVNLTKTSVTVQWIWQEKTPRINVLQYRLELGGPHNSSLIIFPDQQQHTFYHLQTNTKYSVHIYGETESGHFSKANTEFTTPLLENAEIVKAAVPALLMMIGFGIFSVLCRTIYKDYFFPNIANPGHSLIGRWLLNPLHETDAAVCVLKLEDTLTNQLPEKFFTQMEHQKTSERDEADEDMILSEKYLPETCSRGNSESVEPSQVSTGLTEYVDLPLLTDHFGYVENSHSPGSDG